MSTILFENSLEKLARILARQYSINVLFEGNRAYTDGKRIVLPQLTTLTNELKTDFNGYLDHEVGHCKFTQFDEIEKTISKLHKEMLNITEDVRIERLMINAYPGTVHHLEPLNKKLRDKIDEKWNELPTLVRLLIGIADIMLGETVHMDDDTKPYFEAIQSQTVKLNSCSSTASLRELTEEIVRIIERTHEEEKSEEGDGEDEGEEGEEGETGDSSEGESSDESEGEGDSSEDESSDDSEGEGDSSEGGESGSSKDSESSSESKKRREEMSEMLAESAKCSDSAFDDHIFDVHGMINEEIKDIVDGEEKPEDIVIEFSKINKSIPLTTRFDKVTDVTGKGDNVAYANLKRKVQPMISPIRNQLERILKVKENAKWIGERETGKIDVRGLSKMSTDKNYRTVFKDYTKTETSNVAIEILVDMSGSMRGEKMEIAKMSIIAMSEALKDLGINFEVTGFHSKGSREMINAARFAISSPKENRYNRYYEMLDLWVFKSFDSLSLHGLEKIFVGEQNPDGECVSWAAKRLATRKEKRKILIVFSDGLPATRDGDQRILNSDLKSKVEMIEKSGIECIGIGINSDSVKSFYKDNIVVKNIKDLPIVAMNKLAKIVG